MENEEKEDLLLDESESEDDIYEKEECNYYIEEKILDFIQNEKQSNKSNKKTFVFITACLFMFLSSSVLIITLPIYLQYSTRTGIQTYSKLVTLSSVNAILFGIVHLLGVISKYAIHVSSGLQLCLPKVLKISILLSIGSILIFWLIDGHYVSCHLQDPLKGCAIVFSLIFYYVFSRKKMSLERTFCTITIIFGVFVTVDFGICDRFKCNGNSQSTPDVTSRLHFLYVVVYILAHGVWVLHFTYFEICCILFKGSNTNLNGSVLSNVSNNVNSVCDYMKPSSQSLSIICQEDDLEKNDNVTKVENVNRKSYFSSSKLFSRNNRILNNRGANSDNSLNNSVPCTTNNHVSVPTYKEFPEFPITSTPNSEKDSWQIWFSTKCYDVSLWQHVICCLVILSLCWLPTISFLQNGKEKLLAEVINEVCDSFYCHSGWSENPDCDCLLTATAMLSLSYLVLILSSIEVLKTAQSAVTVISVMMSALPMSNLWWSLYKIDGKSASVLEFYPEITGEAVCAMLGFPIIGIGTFLLMKSHIREFKILA